MSTPPSAIELYLPGHLLGLFVTYSPLIVAGTFTSLSFFAQNVKGLVYLGFLLAACFLRAMVYAWSGSPISSVLPMDHACHVQSAAKFSPYGNLTCSVFVFMFTLGYLCLPMFQHGEINYWIFSGLVSYMCIDGIMKYKHQCFPSLLEYVLNGLSGGALGCLFVLLLFSGGSSKYLFFNELSSNKNICQRPSNQTFKCSVYKNGELLGEV